VADIFSTIRDRISSFLGVTHQGQRDTYKQFGYPQALTPELLWSMYLRNGIGNRIVRTYPRATWRKAPIVWDGTWNSPELKSPSFSPFSASVDKLFNVHKAMTYFERADRVSGIGRYGLLVMGFRDGQQMDRPLEPGKHPLLYLAAYGELNIDVNQWDTDTTSPRYGLPTLYTCRTGSISSIVSTGQTSHKKSFTVHHTRVLHLAEVLDEDEVYGTPRLVPVYNWLQDLEKTAGASAETFWFNSRPGLSMSADKEANYSAEAIADMKTQVVEYEHQLRRIFALQGINVSELTAPVADPGPNIEKLLDLIAGTCEIPKRILIGSERGELSSSQDENNFAARVQERSINYAGPYILKPFVQRMIETQNVEQPDGEWGIEWPNAGQTPEQAANVGLTRSNTLRNYVTAPGADVIVPPNEFRREFLNLPAEPEDLPGEEPLDEELPGEDEAPNPDDPEEGAGDEDAANAPPDEKLPAIEEGIGDETRKLAAFLQTMDFDPDQPRDDDDDGKWGDGGGGGDGGESAPASEAKMDAVVDKHSFEAVGGGDPAYKAYFSNPNAMDMNSVARGRERAHLSPADKTRLKKQNNELSNAIKRDARPLEQNTRAYRGVTGKMAAQLSQVKDGQTFTDKGFASTSLNQKWADGFSHGGKAIEIRIPKGRKVMGGPKKGLAGVKEHELLFDRNTKFKKVGVKDGRIILEVQ